MTLTLYTGIDTPKLAIVTESPSLDEQKQRILTAIGNDSDDLPLVDEKTLFTYFEYLSENLSLPFTAHYPEPSNPSEDAQYECVVQELLDPSKYVGDPFDGILCKIRKAGFEVDLPLLEMEIARDDPNYQLIEDYWYWFWNWRRDGDCRTDSASITNA